MNISALVLSSLVVPSLAAAQSAPPAAQSAPPAAQSAPPAIPPAAVPSPVAAAAAPVTPAPAVAAAAPVAPAAVTAPLSGLEPAEEPMGRAGVELALLPVGSLKASAGMANVSADAAVAIGIGGVLQHPIDHTFTVEFAPRLLFNVKGQNDTSSATELDIRARVTAGGYVSPQVRLYAAVSPGYSMLFLPSTVGDTPNPNGLTLGFSAGAAIKVAPAMMLTGELGYQLGFQKATISGMDVDVQSDFLHLAVGMLFDL